VLADTGAGCGNYGVQTVGVDPSNPANLYASWNCQGIWKSTDYGQTWNGPLNNSLTSAGAGGVTVALGDAGDAGPPILYVSNIRGAIGFWVSLDDGVTWTNDNIAPAAAGRQDVYPPVVDPYDPSHLIMAGHEQDLLVESLNGGQDWTNIHIATDGGALTGSGMYENGGTAAIFFIDTGVPSTTRTSFLWMAQATGGTIGTWITTNDGQSWTQVDENEHGHGASQIFQPGGGVVYMAGDYSALGWGVLRSGDYGQTWAHVGSTGSENEVFGTPNNVYATWGWACVPNCNNLLSLEVASQPGTGAWAALTTPNAMNVGGGAAQTAVTFDGTHYVMVLAGWDTGLWRYVEP
jgi:hypothetical protein